MKTIKVKDWKEVPKNFTGKVEYEDGTIEYLLNGKYHRLDGPAKIWPDAYKSYCINGKFICSSSTENYKHIFYSHAAHPYSSLLRNMKKIKNI